MNAHMTWSVKILSLPLAWALYAQALVNPADPSWTRLIESFGLPIALVIFFVWQWYMDKQRMGTRISNLEKFQEDIITKDIEERSLLRNSIDSHAKEVNELKLELRKRPCILTKKDE